MIEVFEIISAINRLKDKIIELSEKIDLIPKSSSVPPVGDYLEEDKASEFLHLSTRTLFRLRSDKIIPFIKSNRRVIYKKSDLENYLSKNNKGNSP